MRICIPTKTRNGFNAKVNQYFDKTLFFTIYDQEEGSLDFVENESHHRGLGLYQPTDILQAKKIDAVILPGIGQSDLHKMNQNGVKVYKTEANTVGEIVYHLEEHFENEITVKDACAHEQSH